jgi:hypothetical protein
VRVSWASTVEQDAAWRERLACSGDDAGNLSGQRYDGCVRAGVKWASRTPLSSVNTIAPDAPNTVN